MFRKLCSVFALTALCANVVTAQGKATVHIVALLFDSDLNPKAVPKHALVITNSRSGERLRVVTGLDGRAIASLNPGEYRLESERSVEFQGRSYQWEQSLSVGTDDMTIELSIDNATVATTAPALKTRADDLPALFQQWATSVVTVWGETGRGTGFVVDSAGLVVTNQHVVGNFDYAAVQFDERTKVRAAIVQRSAEKDIAVLRIAPARTANVSAVRINDSLSDLREGEQVFTIGSPLNQRKAMTSGIISKVEAHAIISDININHGNSGGPLFRMDGSVIGITTFGDLSPQGGPGIAGIVRIDEARDLLRAARGQLAAEAPPSGDLLPVEPSVPYPIAALKEVIQSRRVVTKDYVASTGDFNLMLITPILQYGLQYEAEQAVLSERARRNSKPAAASETIDPLSELRNWEEYVGQYRPVVMIRAQPKLVEGFCSSFGRGYLATRGIAAQASLHFKTDFLSMRIWCGNSEVVPIHPGRVEHRIALTNSAVRVNDATYEGLYILPPDAIGPHCGTVRVDLIEENNSLRVAESRTLDAKMVQMIWDDFAPYRAKFAMPDRSTAVMTTESVGDSGNSAVATAANPNAVRLFGSGRQRWSTSSAGTQAYITATGDHVLVELVGVPRESLPSGAARAASEYGGARIELRVDGDAWAGDELHNPSCGGHSHWRLRAVEQTLLLEQTCETPRTSGGRGITLVLTHLSAAANAPDLTPERQATCEEAVARIRSAPGVTLAAKIRAANPGSFYQLDDNRLEAVFRTDFPCLAR